MTHRVVLYALSTCPHCAHAKRFLSGCRVPYECTDVDLLDGLKRLEVIDEIRKLNPLCSFPTILIDRQVIIGFREAELREALGL